MARKKYRKICNFTFYGEPLTKSNGIIARWNFKRKAIDISHKKSTLVYEAALKEYANSHCDERDIKPTKHHIRLKVNYYLKSRRLKDLPNLPKTTCDALIGNVYMDDSQIVEMSIKKFYDKENPRVEVIADEVLIPDGTSYTDLYPLSYEPTANAGNDFPSEKGTRKDKSIAKVSKPAAKRRKKNRSRKRTNK
tara:strand:+ start:18873 stop:19451 length:579 start_codon:yes stop_codon:yes gene_type:complete